MHSITTLTNSGIYAICNLNTKDQYIGSAIHLRRRHRIHYRSLCRGKHHSFRLQAAWDKYGENSFEFILLERVDNTNELVKIEQKWIDQNKPTYNISPTAISSLGIKRRPETIEKCRKAQTGMKHSEERRKTKSISQGGDNHWTKKKKFSDAARKKMSETHKNLYKNGYIHPASGTKKTPEQIEKMKQVASKAVLQYSRDGEFIAEWPSIKQAALSLGLYSSNIVAVCKNKPRYHTSGGFIWKYKNE